MAKWSLFKKSKPENESNITEETKETIIVQEEPEQDDKPLAEYKETLYTGKSSKKTGKDETSNEQRYWRNVDSIEKKVDKLHIAYAQKPKTSIDKTVDSLIEKNKEKKNRKPSNVIYVVSKPQPGEVKGDWAVRSHGKIFSHHKTKEKAIEEARKIAIKRDATVMVQNTDGTFSDGFKPRSK